LLTTVNKQLLIYFIDRLIDFYAMTSVTADQNNVV